MPTIMPIRDLRKTSEISELAHKKQEPIFIRKNGYNHKRVHGGHRSIGTFYFKFPGSDAVYKVFKRYGETESASQAAPILLDCLSKLEYRGYDSVGLAVRDGENKTRIVKAKGSLKESARSMRIWL